MGFIPAEGLLLGVDADPEAQVMMVEQFIAEVGFWGRGDLWLVVTGLEPWNFMTVSHKYMVNIWKYGNIWLIYMEFYDFPIILGMSCHPNWRTDYSDGQSLRT